MTLLVHIVMVDALLTGDRLIRWTWWWTACLCLCPPMKRRCMEVGVSASRPCADQLSSCWPRQKTAPYRLSSSQLPVTAQTLRIRAQRCRRLMRRCSHVLWKEGMKEKRGPRTLHFVLKRTTNCWVCELTFSLLIASSLAMLCAYQCSSLSTSKVFN